MVAFLVVISQSQLAVGATSAGARCEAGRLKATAKLSFCLLNGESKAVKKGNGAASEEDFAKCQSKFERMILKSEVKYGAACPEDFDSNAILADAKQWSLNVPGGAMGRDETLAPKDDLFQPLGRPSVNMPTRPDAPSLGSGDESSTLAFLDWASSSIPSEREQVRAIITEAAGNQSIAEHLIDEIERALDTDHTRALVALALLGEMRSPYSEGYLREFVWRPLPESGPMAEGVIIARQSLAMLQAKAAAGLAYYGTLQNEMLNIIGYHPSRVVRSEAISAYLYSEGDSESARRLVLEAVRPNEAVFVDRIRRISGMSHQAFNTELAAYLELHPEVVPPDPEKCPEDDRECALQHSEDAETPAPAPEF